MAEAKTKPTDSSVADFLSGLEPADRRDDAAALDALFRKATGFAPRMWGASIIGYGRYSYTYASGHSGEWPATGFAARKAEYTLYIGAGDAQAAPLLAGLGNHRIGKSCLYIKHLYDIDSDVLQQLISQGLERLRRQWPVHPG